MSYTKTVAQCGMSWLLRKIIGLIALLSIQIDNGKAGIYVCIIQYNYIIFYIVVDRNITYQALFAHSAVLD
jgi:hypothetical protein